MNVVVLVVEVGMGGTTTEAVAVGVTKTCVELDRGVIAAIPLTEDEEG